MSSFKRVLIISNNALSLTSNNGKTIWSLFEDYPKENLNQLFTRNELPSLYINSYYRITNKDVLIGRLLRKHRGHCIGIASNKDQENAYKESTPQIKRSAFNCLIRELLWFCGWKSRNLDAWLEDIKPEIIFFVAGDTLYSYAICNYISSKTKASINLYITDDYICKRHKESFLDSVRRKLIFAQLKKILARTKSFFTISEKMRSEYYRILGKDSMPIFNISERLLIKENANEMHEGIILVYMGSLYYGRDDVLIKIANSLVELNKKNEKQAILEVYSNQDPAQSVLERITIPGISMYGGSLSKDEMIKKLNESDVLLFVESFDKEQVEKTRLSLSTKISEYLSVGKPIFAVGPADIGSMEYLNDVAICIHNTEELEAKLKAMITDEGLREAYGKKALKKYNTLGDVRSIRKAFTERLCDV